MPKGHWSFLHEWVIYDYLRSRADEKTLRLRQIFASGKLLGKPRWVKVDTLNPITGTAFPDIQGIKLKGETVFRPAEVKFTTSLFDYHNDPSCVEKLQKFIAQRGLILVAAHDHLPGKGFVDIYPGAEVYEIEIEDFVTFCRENFSRLLNRQIKAHTSTRVWLMYQGHNFTNGEGKILAARESLLWCPTENLTGFDLAPGDRVLFYKTSGVGQIALQNKFLREGIIDPKWTLREIFIAEVRSKIFSRYEYHQYKKHERPKPLWKNDPRIKTGWRWNRVFEFNAVKIIEKNTPMSVLFQNAQSKEFVVKAWEAFCFGKSRELSLKEYRNMLEVLT